MIAMMGVSNLVFYAQSTITVLWGRAMMGTAGSRSKAGKKDRRPCCSALTMMVSARSRWKGGMEDLVAGQCQWWELPGHVEKTRWKTLWQYNHGENCASFVQTAGGNSFSFVALFVRPQNGFLCECLTCSRNKFSSYISPPLGFVENYGANEEHLYIFFFFTLNLFWQFGVNVITQDQNGQDESSTWCTK